MKKKAIVISLILIIAVSLVSLVACWHKDDDASDNPNLIVCENHIDSDLNMACDYCGLILPKKYELEEKEIEIADEDGVVTKIFGNMPNESSLSSVALEKEEAAKLAQDYNLNVNEDNILLAYDISIEVENEKYQPEEYSEEVSINISNLNIDMNKLYAVLHIKDDGSYETLDITEMNENQIKFNTRSFSTYIIIQVDNHDITFNGENYKVKSDAGIEINANDIVTGASNFRFTIEATEGYIVKNITLANESGTDRSSLLEVHGIANSKDCNITAITEHLVVNVETALAPKITTDIVYAKVAVNENAIFNIEMENATDVTWEYKVSGDDYWQSASNIGAVNTTSNTSTLEIVSVTEDMNGYAIRCLLGNADCTGDNKVISSEAYIIVSKENEDINVVYENLEGTAYAVYSAQDNSLRFYKTTDTIIAGSTYNGLTVTNVYTGFEEATYGSFSNVPWYSLRNRIKIVTVENEIKPVSIAYWFWEFENTTTMDLTNLNTSSVTNMSMAFSWTGYIVSNFSLIGLNQWDTSSVTDMSNMFYEVGYNATPFSLDLSSFDTTKVSNMENMLYGLCKLSEIKLGEKFTFNGNGTSRKTYLPTPSSSYITGADGMWYNKSTKVGYVPADIPNNTAATYTAVNPNLIAYAVYSSKDNSLRFYKTTETIKKGSTYNNLPVTEVYTGFEESIIEYAGGAPWSQYKYQITNVVVEDTIQPKSTAYWFWQFTDVAKMDLSRLDTSNVLTMNNMFEMAGYDVESFTIIGLDKWNTKNVKDMSDMFKDTGHEALTFDIGDLSSFNVESVQNMSNMFWGAGFKSNEFSLDLSSWNTGLVKDMSKMFYEAGFSATTWSLGNISSWDTSSVTNMNRMFANAGNSVTTTLNMDLSGWNTSSVTNMDHLFSGMGYNAPKVILNIKNWDTSNVTTMYSMFGIPKLYEITLGENFNFNGSGNKKLCDLPSVSESFNSYSIWFNKETGEEFLNNTIPNKTAATYVAEVPIPRAYAIYSEDDNSLRFYKNKELLRKGQIYNNLKITEIFSDIEKVNYTGPTVVAWYSRRNIITKVVFEDAIAPISTAFWFFEVKNITTIDLSKLDTSKVTTMTSMFYRTGVNAESFTLTGLDKWDTSKVLNMADMFYQTGYNATNLITLDLSGWDTSNVIEMKDMFLNMIKLSQITLGEKFTFNGSGDTRKTNLPVPLNSYIPGTDGKWYNVSTNVGYAPADVPNNTAATYVASKELLVNEDSKMITEWTIPSGDTTITLPVTGTGLDIMVDWGDGSEVQHVTTEFPTHKYTEANKYDITIWGTCPEWGLNDVYYNEDKSKILPITEESEYYTQAMYLTGLKQWGELSATRYVFAYCENLKYVSGDATENTFDNVTTMMYMFYGCTSLERIDLSKFNTSNVTNMRSMFNGCTALTSLDLSKFNTSQVTSMASMFTNCTGLTSLDVSKFNTSQVTSMVSMFTNCTGLTSLDVSNFDTSNVTSMQAMFYNCPELTSLDVSNFNTSKVTRFNDMFGFCKLLTSLDLSNFNTSNATYMQYMFAACYSLKSLNLSSLDTSKVISMKNMFDNSYNLNSILVSNKFIVSGDTANMFTNGNASLKVITTSSTPVANQFKGKLTSNRILYVPNQSLNSYITTLSGDVAAENIKPILTLNGENTINVKIGGTYTEPGYKVAGFTPEELKALGSGDKNLFGFNVAISGDVNTNVDGKYPVEYVLTRTYTLNGTTITTEPIKETREVEVIDKSKYMITEWTIPSGDTTITLPVTGEGLDIYVDWGDGSEVQHVTTQFPTHKYTTAKTYDITVWGNCPEWGLNDIYRDESGDVVEITEDKPYYTQAKYLTGLKQWGELNATRYGFSYCENLKYVSGDATENTFDNVTTMLAMFYKCTSLKEIDLINFDTSNVTNMEHTFLNCSSLEYIDVSKFNTSKVTNMGAMFSRCTSLKEIDVSNFDTSKVTNMTNMFRYCGELTELDLSNFNTSKVTNMLQMFYNCSSLTSLDVSKFNTSQVENMRLMFFGCSALTSLDVSKFNTSKVTNMSSMFNGCSALTSLDVSKFDTSKVTNMLQMFYNCSSLTSLDVSKFNTSQVENMRLMFYGCGKLKNIDVSNFDTSSAENISSMFNRCGALTNVDVSNFDTSKATEMQGMFLKCSSLTNLDLSTFDTSKVTNMNQMFNETSALNSILVSNKFIASGDTTNMFTGSNSSLKLITTSATPVANQFKGVMPTTATLYVPNQSLNSYITTLSGDVAAENIKPILTLNGENTINVKIGGTYTEPGYKVAEYTPEELKALGSGDVNLYGFNVELSGDVDVNVAAIYPIKYKLTRTYSGDTITEDVAAETRNVEVTKYSFDEKGSVTTIGTNTYGETLTADISKITPPADSYTYQWWYADSADATTGTTIDGATSQSYTIGSGFAGKFIGVTVTANKENYESKAYTDITDASNITAVVSKIDREVVINKTIELLIGETKTVDFTYTGDDVLAEVESNNNAVATVELTDANLGGSIKITSVAIGDSIITIKIPESTNYKAKEIKCTLYVLSDKPDVPTDFKASIAEYSDEIIVTWEEVEGLKYELYAKTIGEDWQLLNDDVTSPYSHSRLESDSFYEYRIRAYNEYHRFSNYSYTRGSTSSKDVISGDVILDTVLPEISDISIEEDKLYIKSGDKVTITFDVTDDNYYAEYTKPIEEMLVIKVGNSTIEIANVTINTTPITSGEHFVITINEFPYTSINAELSIILQRDSFIDKALNGNVTKQTNTGKIVYNSKITTIAPTVEQNLNTVIITCNQTTDIEPDNVKICYEYRKSGDTDYTRVTKNILDNLESETDYEIRTLLEDVTGNVVPSESTFIKTNKAIPVMRFGVSAPLTGTYVKGTEITILGIFTDEVTIVELPKLIVKFGSGEEIELTGTMDQNLVTYKYTLTIDDLGLLEGVKYVGSVKDSDGELIEYNNPVTTLEGNKIIARTGAKLIENSVETYYSYLQDAIDNANDIGNHSTVIMIKDEELLDRVEISDTKNIELDLNGKDIIITGDEVLAILNKGNLIIKEDVGTGEIYANGITSAMAIENFGVLDIINGQIKATVKEINPDVSDLINFCYRNNQFWHS